MSAVAISRDGRHALSGSRDRTLKLWDLANRPASPHSCRPRRRGNGGVGDIAGKAACLSGSRDRTLTLWDLATGPAPAHAYRP